MDPAILAGIEEFVTQELSDTTSILVVRNGYIVFEKYYGCDQARAHSLYSVTKTAISILVGSALQEGLIKSIDDRVENYLPEPLLSEMSEAARGITIRHLLNMTAGFADDGGVGANNLSSIKRLLSQELESPPGKLFAYNGSGPNLLSIIIGKVSGKSASEYAKERLFNPLAIQEPVWWGSYEFTNGAYGLSLTTRDMAKLGYLYLKDGKWADKQIVTRAYVRQSTKELIDIPEKYKDSDERYGYLWWSWTCAGYPLYTAAGWNGQFISVVPKLDLVVAMTGMSGGDSSKRPQIISDYVIKAIETWRRPAAARP